MKLISKEVAGVIISKAAVAGEVSKVADVAVAVTKAVAMVDAVEEAEASPEAEVEASKAVGAGAIKQIKMDTMEARGAKAKDIPTRKLTKEGTKGATTTKVARGAIIKLPQATTTKGSRSTTWGVGKRAVRVQMRPPVRTSVRPAGAASETTSPSAPSVMSRTRIWLPTSS